MKNTIYVLALAATTLTSLPITANESIVYDINVNYTVGLKSTTSERIADNSRYLNSVMINNSFQKRLIEKKLCGNLPKDIKDIFDSICETCSYFNLKEVYADYSPVSNAIRIDMIIDNDFLLIVRKIIEKDGDNFVAVSLSKENEDYLVDYLELNNLIKEVNYYINNSNV